MQRLADVGCGDAERCKAIGFQPDTHGDDSCPEDIGTLDPIDGGEFGLDDACQVISHLVGLQMGSRESQVHRCAEFVRVLKFDRRGLGLRGELIAYLSQFCLNLREGCVRIVVQLQVNRDRAESLIACALDVVDPLGCRDHPFQRGCDVASDEVGVCPDKDR